MQNISVNPSQVTLVTIIKFSGPIILTELLPNFHPTFLGMLKDVPDETIRSWQNTTLEATYEYPISFVTGALPLSSSHIDWG